MAQYALVCLASSTFLVPASSVQQTRDSKIVFVSQIVDRTKWLQVWCVCAEQVSSISVESVRRVSRDSTFPMANV